MEEGVGDLQGEIKGAQVGQMGADGRPDVYAVLPPDPLCRLCSIP